MVQGFLNEPSFQLNEPKMFLSCQAECCANGEVVRSEKFSFHAIFPAGVAGMHVLLLTDQRNA